MLRVNIFISTTFLGRFRYFLNEVCLILLSAAANLFYLSSNRMKILSVREVKDSTDAIKRLLSYIN